MKMMTTTMATAALALGSFAHAGDKHPAGSYQIDPAHSKVGFEIPHLVISSVEGRFTGFEGSVDLGSAFNKSAVKAAVDLQSVDTGNSKRDEHLRSPDFFDVAKNPKMTFESLEIKGSPDSFKMTGNLTIKGVTRKVVFDGRYLGSAVDGYGNEKIAFSAKTKISRKDYGLTWNAMVEAGPVVGDEVAIELKIQAGRPVAKKS